MCVLKNTHAPLLFGERDIAVGDNGNAAVLFLVLNENGLSLSVKSAC